MNKEGQGDTLKEKSGHRVWIEAIRGAENAKGKVAFKNTGADRIRRM